MPYHDDQRFTVSKRVLSRVLDGDAVLLDLGAGKYFSLDAVGTHVWEGLERGATVGELHARILSAFEVDAAQAKSDLDALLADLLSRGLIA
jgi:hypothetical protein